MATMFPGVRPSISFASLPTASTSPVFLLMATIEGSFTTMPLPLAYTNVFAVPRSMARSLENMLKSERRLWMREFSDLKPFDDILALFKFHSAGYDTGFPTTCSLRSLTPRTLYEVISATWQQNHKRFY